MSILLPIELPVSHNIYDIACLSEEYNKSSSDLTRFDIVSKAKTCEIPEIIRLSPGRDLDNPVLYSKIKELSLVDKNTKPELIDIFTYTDEDASQALIHFNIEVFLYIIKNHLGGKFNPSPDLVGNIAQEYRKYKSQASITKIMCLAPYAKFDDKKINKLILQEFKLTR